MAKKFGAATRKAETFEVVFKAEVEERENKICEVAVVFYFVLNTVLIGRL